MIQAGSTIADAELQEPTVAAVADSVVPADSLSAGGGVSTGTAPSRDDMTPAVGAGDTTAAAAEIPVDGPAAEPAESSAEPASAFDMAAYRGTVGEAGWALHVYSLSSTADTAKQVEELTRRGFKSEVRIIDLGEKGRWFRIYLGSFATRAEAKAAMPALLAELRVDWAKPERITTSAPE